jgi:hypothetical protein
MVGFCALACARQALNDDPSGMQKTIDGWIAQAFGRVETSLRHASRILAVES